jgi:hypothetical protein
MEKTNAEEYILITNAEYYELDNPEFIGQTRVDENNMYYMFWKSNGVLYKTHNKLKEIK